MALALAGLLLSLDLPANQHAESWVGLLIMNGGET